MGLLNFIQIPCHHVLANEIALNMKYRIGHFFNINLGIGIIKKNYFFCSYFRHISLCFYSNFDLESLFNAELNSTFNGYPVCILLIDLSTPPKKEIPKKRDDDVNITFFQIFLIFGVAGSVKSMQCGYSLDVESKFSSKYLYRSKFE